MKNHSLRKGSSILESDLVESTFKPLEPETKILPNPTSRRKILQVFSATYPEPRSELVFHNDFQLLVAVVLSAQCTDKKVNQVTPALFAKYPDFVGLGEAELSNLENIIRPINYYKTKAKNLKALGNIVAEKYHSSLPSTLADLTSLPGVGHKTASVVLGETGVQPTLPVDTHVFRVSKRLGWAAGKNVALVEAELKKIFQEKTWRHLHHWLILHGRRICSARRPNCELCQIAKFCPKIGLKTNMD